MKRSRLAKSDAEFLRRDSCEEINLEISISTHQEIYRYVYPSGDALIRPSRSNMLAYFFRPTHEVAWRLVYLPIRRYTGMSTH